MNMENPKELVIALQQKGFTITEISAILAAPKDTVLGWRYGNKSTTLARFNEMKLKAKPYLG